MSFFVPIYFAMAGVVILTVWPTMRIAGHSGFVIDRRLELYQGAPAPVRPDATSDDAHPTPPREAVVHP